MFVISWVILSTNAVLVERLARRVVSTGPVPVMAGIFFLLFPADTNRPFLCAGHILQPSLTFMLIGAHLFLSGKLWQKIACYVLVAACLLTYENAMLPIFAVPLLQRVWDRAWFRRSLWHAGWVSAVVLIDSVARTALGEYRVMQANHSPIITVLEIIAGTIIGPATCLHACEVRSAMGLFDSIWRHPHARALLASGTGLFALVIGSTSRWGHWRPSIENVGRALPDENVTTSSARPTLDYIDYQTEAAERLSRVPEPFVTTDLGRLAWFGLAAVFVSYLFSFTHFPPFLEEGQSTSTHLAAAVGGGILLACGVGAFLNVRTSKIWWRPLVILVHIPLHRDAAPIGDRRAGRLRPAVATTTGILGPGYRPLPRYHRRHDDYLRRVCLPHQLVHARYQLVRDAGAAAVVQVPDRLENCARASAVFGRSVVRAVDGVGHAKLVGPGDVERRQAAVRPPRPR